MAEEMIDILNSDGTPAGYSRGRTEVHAKADEYLNSLFSTRATLINIDGS